MYLNLSGGASMLYIEGYHEVVYSNVMPWAGSLYHVQLIQVTGEIIVREHLFFYVVKPIFHRLQVNGPSPSRVQTVVGIFKNLESNVVTHIFHF